MCWVALDPTVALADLLGVADRIVSWTTKRNLIWETVVRAGWSDTAGAFTQYPGSTTLDAAT
jgi:GH15 family glucan-1,4-alpha-glucosidase